MKMARRITDQASKALWYFLTAKRYPAAFTRARKLKEFEARPHEEIEAFQFREAKSLVAHAYATCEFYRKKFNNCGLHPEDIRDWKSYRLIPPLTKEEIQAHRERMISISADRRNLIQDATGGSTGQPMVFFWDRDAADWSAACDMYIKRRWGVEPWCKKAYLWGADRDIPEMTLKEKLRMALERERILNSFNMEPTKIEEYAESLQSWQPGYVQGYASSLWFFSDFVLNKGIELPQPVVVRSSAETLFDNQRALIERVFGKNVFNFYGSREVTNIAAECVSHTGLHVFSPIRVVEIVNERGRPAEALEPGRILVTDLVNRSMPFIRYDIGDVGVMGNRGCGCGCNFEILKEVLGRQTDLIKTRDGRFIHGEFFTHLFYGLKGIAKFQVYQRDLSSIDIRIVKTDGFNPHVIEKIKAKVEERTNFTTNVAILIVNEIPNVASGKRRFTISEVSNDIRDDRCHNGAKA